MLPEFNSKHIYARMRRLAVPITIGMFLITITSLGIVCVQQLIVQKNIRAQIQTNTLAYKSADKDEKFQEKFEVASKAIPVISSNQLAEFQEQIISRITGIAINDYIINGSDAGSFSMIYVGDTEYTISGQKYTASTFSLELRGIDNTLLNSFIKKIESLPDLQSIIVIEPVTVNYTLQYPVAKLDIAVYMRIK